MTLADLYTGVAGHYPLSAFSQFNRLADSTQLFFYILTRARWPPPDDWPAQMQASVAASGPRTRTSSPTPRPAQHCVINSPELTPPVGGVRLVEWLRRLAETGRASSVP